MKFESELVQQFYDEAMLARDQEMEPVMAELHKHRTAKWFEEALKVGLLRTDQTRTIMESAVKLQLKADKNMDLKKVHIAAVMAEAQKP